MINIKWSYRVTLYSWPRHFPVFCLMSITLSSWLVLSSFKFSEQGAIVELTSADASLSSCNESAISNDRIRIKRIDYKLDKIYEDNKIMITYCQWMRGYWCLHNRHRLKWLRPQKKTEFVVSHCFQWLLWFIISTEKISWIWGMYINNICKEE